MSCLALINNSEAILPDNYVNKSYRAIGQPVMVNPDAGAYKSNYTMALGAEMVAANKIRRNGEPYVQILGNVKGKECLIVDDIADGGRTFIQLAESLKQQGASKVFLYVTHGMFHFGFDELKIYIDHTYCTNSYADIEHELVTQYKLKNT